MSNVERGGNNRQPLSFLPFLFRPVYVVINSENRLPVCLLSLRPLNNALSYRQTVCRYEHVWPSCRWPPLFGSRIRRVPFGERGGVHLPFIRLNTLRLILLRNPCDRILVGKGQDLIWPARIDIANIPTPGISIIYKRGARRALGVTSRRES